MRSKKITKRLRKTQYKRKISRKTQKGGAIMTAVLRKNGHLKGDKDIKEFRITNKGIEYKGGLKKLGSTQLIPYSKITNVEFTSPNTLYVDTNKKNYIFDNVKPCEGCARDRKFERFYDRLNKKLVRFNKKLERSSKPLETIKDAVNRLDEISGLTPQSSFDSIPNDDVLWEEFEKELMNEGSLEGGRKHKNKSRKSKKSKRRHRKTKKTSCKCRK